MPQLSDTNMQSGSDVCHVVYCWNPLHDRRKIFKSYGTDQKQADIDVAALRAHGIEAERLVVGEKHD
jgi:hypothetical protein